MNTVDVVDQRYFRNMDQSPEGCFYFPEPQLDVAVVFPGQCDTTVPVVQNFNFTQVREYFDLNNLTDAMIAQW